LIRGVQGEGNWIKKVGEGRIGSGGGGRKRRGEGERRAGGAGRLVRGGCGCQRHSHTDHSSQGLRHSRRNHFSSSLGLMACCLAFASFHVPLRVAPGIPPLSVLLFVTFLDGRRHVFIRTGIIVLWMDSIRGLCLEWLTCEVVVLLDGSLLLGHPCESLAQKYISFPKGIISFLKFNRKFIPILKICESN
jgi:hypothetical protein